MEWTGAGVADQRTWGWYPNGLLAMAHSPGMTHFAPPYRKGDRLGLHVDLGQHKIALYKNGIQGTRRTRTTAHDTTHAHALMVGGGEHQ
jgi:hypothetical protein